MDFLPDGVAFNKEITYLAKTNFRNQEQVFGIKRKDRRQHIYVLGKSGTGKSTLLEGMIVQNIWNGEGVCVVDPHGELVENILASIPPHRVKDVVYFNPADTDYHIGFNVLQIDDPKYKHLVASGLMGIFTKIWANAWSARMEYILNNAILALSDTPGSTLLGIPRLLVDKDYRQLVVNNLKDPVIKAFWVHEYEAWRDQYRNEAIAPIQNKVGQFLSSSMVRNVVGQAKSTIDIFDMMNTGKIFLVNVSKGRIGEDNSALLGGMLITKIQLAAMERVRIPEDERKDFYMYVDEFQNFVTDSFASILSEARKYRLNLTLAHQYIAQLVTKESMAVRDAVFGNVGTMIIFRVGAADAEFLEPEVEPEFLIQDLVNLPNYTIYLKLMVDGITSRPFSAKTLPPFKTPADSNVTQQIVESSRKLYARPREDVERDISEWSGMVSGGPSGNTEGEGKFKAVCSACGKETTVPFEPEAGRPIYCKDCIAKIKSGELKPVKGTTRARALEPQSFAPLANLGIEFSPEKKEVPVARPATVNPAPVPPVVSVSTPPPVSATIPNKPVSPTLSRPARSIPTIQKAPAPITKPAPVPQKPISTPSVAPVAKPTEVSRSVTTQASPKIVSRPAPEREIKKGPDHAGLQDLLKQALGDTITKNEVKPKVETPVATPVEEKKTISLASLKNSEIHSGIKMQTKTASDEHVNSLAAAIAKAQRIHNEQGSKNKEQIEKEEKPNEPKPDTVGLPDAPKETLREEDPKPKKIREVPEDVLRKVLSE